MAKISGEEIVQRYQSGESLKSLYEAAGSMSHIYYALKKYHIPLRTEIKREEDRKLVSQFFEPQGMKPVITTIRDVAKEIRAIAERIIEHDLEDNLLNEKLLTDWMDLTVMAEILDGEDTPAGESLDPTLYGVQKPS